MYAPPSLNFDGDYLRLYDQSSELYPPRSSKAETEDISALSIGGVKAQSDPQRGVVDLTEVRRVAC